MFDALVSDGFLVRYREAKGEAPAEGWVRVDKAQLLSLPRRPAVLPPPAPEPAHIIVGAGGSRWKIDADGKVVRA